MSVSLDKSGTATGPARTVGATTSVSLANLTTGWRSFRTSADPSAYSEPEALTEKRCLRPRRKTASPSSR